MGVALVVGEVEVRRVAREEYYKYALLEKASWMLEFRGILLKKGDRNTQLFLKMANMHRIRNFFYLGLG